MVPNPASLKPVVPIPANTGGRALLFINRHLPWLLGVLMLGVYGLTLNHWVSADSIVLAANLEGLNPTPEFNGPFTYLLTYPFGQLPANSIPLLINLFTAVCAAVSLALLARSVALLPHDLAKDKRRGRRRREPPKLLTGGRAWLPPVLAVLVCGLQLSFWQNAVTATSEMFNLLLFAYVIRCFLEFNASRRDSWLLRGALVYGLAVANDWVMAAFFPAFLVALIWIKNIFLFNEKFLKRLLRHPRSFRRQLLWQIPGCFLAGLALFLLLPALARYAPVGHLGFWPALKHTYTAYKASLTHFPRTLLVTSALISVMPIFLMSLRFYQFLAGFNRLNAALGAVFFHLTYAFFLLVCLWTMLDSPLSPRRLGLGIASLPVYFLAALSVGCFAGHFLLVSEIQPEPVKRRRRRSSRTERRLKLIRRTVRALKLATLAGVGLVALAAPVALLYKNLPVITRLRTDACDDYIRRLSDALPPDGAVLLGSDQFRLAYLEAVLMRNDRQNGYLLLNIEMLEQTPGYLDFVKQLNPGFNLNFNLPDPADPASHRRLSATLLRYLAQNHDIYCLSPVPLADPLDDFFYFQPAGLLYQLKPFRRDQTLPDATPAGVTDDNETFWKKFESQDLPALDLRINPPKPPLTQRLSRRFLNTLRFWPEPDHDAVIAGVYYASALNDWGVELQKAGKFPTASRCFAEALELSSLNPNPAAQLNQKFNTDYLAHREETLQRPQDTALSLNEYRDWRHVVRDGIVDEPNFNFMLGTFLEANHMTRSAIAQFERVRALSPGWVETYASLSRLFLQCNDSTNALETANRLLAMRPASQSGLALASGAYVEMKAYDQAFPLLDEVLKLDPTNLVALNSRALARRQTGQLAGAQRDYEAILQLTTNAFSIYYTLGEIADEEKDPAAAITNYQKFLQSAPPGLPEIETAQTRLNVLKPGAMPELKANPAPLF